MRVRSGLWVRKWVNICPNQGFHHFRTHFMTLTNKTFQLLFRTGWKFFSKKGPEAALTQHKPRAWLPFHGNMEMAELGRRGARRLFGGVVPRLVFQPLEQQNGAQTTLLAVFRSTPNHTRTTDFPWKGFEALACELDILSWYAVPATCACSLFL